jgi:hypothetical protein
MSTLRREPIDSASSKSWVSGLFVDEDCAWMGRVMKMHPAKIRKNC